MPEAADSSDASTELELRSASIADLPSANVDALRELWGEPCGAFLRGRDGITHFHLESPATSNIQQRFPLAIFSHGIGTSVKVYERFRKPFLDAGFRILRYDFLGHGWSHVDDGVWFTHEMLINQVDELLRYTLAPDEPLDLFVGHSTGGLLGGLFAASGKRQVRELALISPALWKVAPFLVKVTDAFPSVFRRIVPVAKALGLIEKTYMENNDSAFARNGDTYLYPEQHSTAREEIANMFRLHPQINEAITGVTCDTLRADLLLQAQEVFRGLVAREKESVPRVGLMWGTRDVVVEFHHSQEFLEWPGADECVTLHELVDMGHESVAEDGARVAKEVLAFTRLRQ